jgi:hypothetical protein
MRHKRVDVKHFKDIGVRADIFYFHDYRHQFYYILHNGDVSVRSHCYPTKNICLDQLTNAIKTLWNL